MFLHLVAGDGQGKGEVCVKKIEELHWVQPCSIFPGHIKKKRAMCFCFMVPEKVHGCGFLSVLGTRNGALVNGWFKLDPYPQLL